MQVVVVCFFVSQFAFRRHPHDDQPTHLPGTEATAATDQAIANPTRP